ncbi:unnamed protein product, partial [Ectocarpus sp. 12 AP-2014]
ADVRLVRGRLRGPSMPRGVRADRWWRHHRVRHDVRHGDVLPSNRYSCADGRINTCSNYGLANARATTDPTPSPTTASPAPGPTMNPTPSPTTASPTPGPTTDPTPS